MFPKIARSGNKGLRFGKPLSATAKRIISTNNWLRQNKQLKQENGLRIDSPTASVRRFTSQSEDVKEYPKAIAIVVHLQLNKDVMEEFWPAIIEDIGGSRKNEPGCLRFDIYRDPEDETKFTFHEAYVDMEAFEAHKAAPHFKSWQRFSEKEGNLVSIDVKILDVIDFQ